MRKNVWYWGGVGLLLLAVVLYGGGLGRYHLLDPDEGRYGEIPREMLERGDLITPTLNYVKYFEKPPLFYWLVAAVMTVFGEQEWAVRGVAAAAGLLTAWMVWALGGTMWGARTGLIALWVYLGSLLPMVLARLPIIDGLFGACLTACFAAWWRGYAAGRGRRTWWMVLSWACLGLAVMAKGPTAIVLAALLVVCFLGMRREWSVLREMAWLPGLAVFAVITVPWHVAVSLRNPEFPHFYFVVQHLLRATGNEHLRPWWYFLVIAPAGMGAWMVPSILAFIAAVGASCKRPAGPENDDAQRAAGLFCVLWAAVVVFFFSLSRCKLVPYIQPALPGLALLVAWRLAAGDAARTPWRVALAITGALLLAVVAAAPKLAADQDVVPVSGIGPFVVGLRISLGVAGLAMLLGAWKVRWATWVPSLPVLLLAPVLVLSIPLFAQYKRTGALIEPMLPRLPANLRIAEYRNYDQSLSFYTHRRIVLVDFPDELAFGRDQGDNSAWFLTGADSLRRLSAEGPLLVNIATKTWTEARSWEFLRPVAANTSNIMLANDAFFAATGFAPYEPDAIQPGARLLMPKDAGGGP
jgi:4-amino-4-deoxy-L-arabinose transferase-like glycosyltransferase